MALDRDALIDALTERLRVKMPLLRTLSRVARHWDDVPPSEQPAAFVALGEMAPTYSAVDSPPIWTVNALVYLYAQNGAPDEPTIAGLVSSLEAALERDDDLDPIADASGRVFPPNAYYTTLGGKCQRARIGAPISTDEGTLGAQAVARVIVEMVTVG